jgi:organic radical activating enzyme
MTSPIKVQAYADEFPYKLVEWKLHDKCNFNCSFCGDENKLGILGWLDLEANKAIVDSIVKSAKGSPLWIQLTGGEPTLYPNFIELLTYIKQQGAMIGLISNGSRTIRWWKLLKETKLIDLLFITFHSQQKADYKHIAEVTNLFLDEETVTINAVTYIEDSIDYAIEGIEYLIENTGSAISTNAMDFGSDSRLTETSIGAEKFNKIVNDYNIILGKNSQNKKQSTIPSHLMPFRSLVTIEYSDGSYQEKDVTQMMKLGENRFQDWTCFSGIDTMVIENGIKFRGGCKRDATTFESGNLTFFDKPFKCDVDDCYCAMDMITTKIKTKV